MFQQAGNVIHRIFIPVVHAQQAQPECLDDDNVWNRLKGITNAKQVYI